MPVGRICPERGHICTDDRCLARAGRSGRTCQDPARAARVKQERATDPVRRIRNSARYQRWREAVKRRDGYRCVRCGATKNIDAHHIESIEERPDLAFDVGNGRALCRPCHRREEARLIR